MTREDIDRIALEYFDDKESEHEMDEVFDLAKKALEERKEDMLDKIRSEIEQAANKQFQIALGVSNLNERYAHIQMENAYRHSLNVIDKYRKSEG